MSLPGFRTYLIHFPSQKPYSIDFPSKKHFSRKMNQVRLLKIGVAFLSLGQVKNHNKASSLVFYAFIFKEVQVFFYSTVSKTYLIFFQLAAHEPSHLERSPVPRECTAVKQPR